jgi:GTP-binding protein HflX
MSDDFDDEGHKGGPQAFIDQREHPTRVGLICPDVRGLAMRHSIEARQAEFEGLAHAIRVDVVFSETAKVREIKPATFLGGGTVEAIAQKVIAGAAAQPRNRDRCQGARPDRPDP